VCRRRNESAGVHENLEIGCVQSEVVVMARWQMRQQSNQGTEFAVVFLAVMARLEIEGIASRCRCRN
jgi:hypothetical protein